MARIVALRQLYYPRDPKLRREVDALVAAGHEVDVICLRRAGEKLFERQSPSLHIVRIPIQHRRGSMLLYLAEYATVLVLVAILLMLLHAVRRYQLVQVNTPPDGLVFAAIVPRVLGVPVLLQLQEPMPEFFATKFGRSRFWMGIVSVVEQSAIRFATSIITCTTHMRERFVERGADRAKIQVVLLSSDEDEFDAARHPSVPRRDGHFVLVSHGSIEERYGLDTAIRAIALLRYEIPGLMLRIYGDGSDRQRLQRLVEDLDLRDRVWFSNGWVPLGELLDGIASADAGLVAMKRDDFRDLTHNLKMFDFITMKRPAIVSRTRSVDDYFDDDCFLKFTADDPQDLARAIRLLYADPVLGERMVARSSAVNQAYRWPDQRAIYLETVSRLLTARRANPSSASATVAARER